MVKVFPGVLLVSLAACAVLSCSEQPTRISSASDSAALLTGAHRDSATTTVLASGLINPRGLKFGPDGYLYVAEAGTGGDRSTEGECEQVPPPVGPYHGNRSARVSRVSMDGQVTVLADDFPSAQTGPAIGSDNLGLADVAFIGGTMYGLVQGGGCSHGNPDVPNGIVRIEPDGSWTTVADLSTFYQNNPVMHPEEEDFEPDGSPYSMVAYNGRLLVLEANHGELDQVNPMTGLVRRLIDISASHGHIVPTALALDRGYFYMGNLTTFPFTDGTAIVMRWGLSSSVKLDYLHGLTAVLGIAFDSSHRMYILETSTGNAPPNGFQPNSGRVVRVRPDFTLEEVVSGLNFPGGMVFGPDDILYVSNQSFLTNPPDGQILKIDLHLQPATAAAVALR